MKGFRVRLYHSTSIHFLDKIKETGILPRSLSRVSGMWGIGGTSKSSNPNLVYFSKSKQGIWWHTLRSAVVNYEYKAIVFGVELNKIKRKNLRADENFIAAFPSPSDIKKAEFDRRWKASLNVFGSVAYRGSIDPKAIVDVSIVEVDHTHPLYKKSFFSSEDITERCRELDRVLSYTQMFEHKTVQDFLCIWHSI